ncbi:MAG TPA: sigma-70 family RNA polymerase sigma factor, partial [Polyangia bacterium]
MDPASTKKGPALRLVRGASAAPAARAVSAVREVERVPVGFEETYRRYSRYVAAIVLRLDPRVPDLDDVVQDVFLAAAGGLKRLRDPGAIRAWLATTTVRMVRRRLRVRRMWRWLGLGQEARPPAPLVDAGNSPVDRLLLRAVYDVLDRLPVADRVAFVLYQIEGETLESVAEICRCSLATIKRRVARAQRA